MDNRTPKQRNWACSSFVTPPYTSSLSQELKQVLNERNLLTAKSRKKVCSMLDNMSPKVSCSSDTNKRKNFRLQAVQEIFSSERSYIAQLQILMKYFVHPLKDILNSDEFTMLFGQIEMIYNLNTELLKTLEKDLAKIGAAFLRMAPFFKLYSVYAFDYNRSQMLLQELTEKNQKFRRFLESTESRPEVQTKLMSLLIAPIQRVPRYRLLLQQVILYSSPLVDDDFKILQDSLKEVENTVSHMNSVVQEQELTQMIIDLQNSLVDRLPNIVKPSRKIIKEGVLQKMSSSGVTLKRYCILMSDIFMYCKILKDRNKNSVSPNSLQCSCIFPLKKCRISEIFPGTFKVTCQGDGIILCSDDLTTSKGWMNAIKETIEVHIQCRKTIRKGSSKRKPVRNKEVKHFEVEEVLSPSRKKYDYESVYRCKDLSDSESDVDEQNLCFDFNAKKLFKRKHCDEDATKKKKIKSTNVAPPLKRKSKWLRRKAWTATEITPDAAQNDFDSTYAFAKRLKHQSYFRNQNVDSSIPLDDQDIDQFQDVLYPLRTSNGSIKSTTSSNRSNTDYCCNNAKALDSNMTQHDNSNLPSISTSTARKRVKFDDRSNKINVFQCNSPYSQQRPPSYTFTNELNQNKLTLKQRIANFFANLF